MHVILTPVDSARNLGIILDRIFLFLNTSHLIPNPASSLFLIYGVFDRIGSILPLLLLRLSFTLKLTTATLSCSIFLLLNRLQLVLNSAARAVTRTPKLHHVGSLFPILKYLHWLTINQIIQYKVLCLTHFNVKKLVTHLISAPFCHPHLTVQLVLHLSSHLIILLLLLV